MSNQKQVESPKNSQHFGLVINTIEHPTTEHIEEVRKRLQEYNKPYWEVKDKETIVLRLSDCDSFSAGAVLSVYGTWLEISFLFVNEDRRGKGIGKLILKEIEDLARARACTKICLNTFSFQARPFYEKCGYTVVYEKKNYPITSNQYFLEKDIMHRER